jgi:hypothetical protein
MAEPVHPVAASDRIVSALSERRQVDDADPVLRALQAWVQRIDARPVAPWSRPVPVCVKTASGGELARRVAALTLALTLSSTGLAAAVTGDPLSPLHFVKREIHKFGPPGGRHAPRCPEPRYSVDRDGGYSPRVSRSSSHRAPLTTRRAGSRVVRHSPSP